MVLERADQAERKTLAERSDSQLRAMHVKQQLGTTGKKTFCKGHATNLKRLFLCVLFLKGGGFPRNGESEFTLVRSRLTQTSLNRCDFLRHGNGQQILQNFMFNENRA